MYIKLYIFWVKKPEFGMIIVFWTFKGYQRSKVKKSEYGTKIDVCTLKSHLWDLKGYLYLKICKPPFTVKTKKIVFISIIMKRTVIVTENIVSKERLYCKWTRTKTSIVWPLSVHTAIFVPYSDFLTIKTYQSTYMMINYRFLGKHDLQRSYLRF